MIVLIYKLDLARLDADQKEKLIAPQDMVFL